MNDLPINIDIALEAYQIVTALTRMDYEDCLEFIMIIDLDQTDVGFTKKLIVQLAKSMKIEVDAGLPLNEIDELNFIDWSKV